jgi:adenosylcobyric acid synthase
MRRRGIAAAISDLAADGVPVVGICGGYQMLGRTILDPDGVESDRPEIDGLGLLPVTTTFVGRKETVRVTGSVAAGRGLLAGAEGLPLEGYEIHMGVTEGNVEDHPFRTAGLATTSERDDGCLSADGWTAGTYIHGLFHNTALRRSVLNRLAERKGVSLSFEDDDFSQSAEFDKLAALIRDSIDVAAVYRAAGLKVGSCGAGSP